VLLSDSSEDLISCYTAVRDEVEGVIGHLEQLESGHRTEPARHYYEVRDERFNPARRELRARKVSNDAGAVGSILYHGPELAAMMIYLNRTGYNGLFRLNAAGDFNVPLGRYERPRICDAPGLRGASAALREAQAELRVMPFRTSLARAATGDFVYLDPPYVPLSATARFTAYTAGGFDGAAQEALCQAVVELARQGAQVVLSNSAADEVKALYADDPGVRRAGLRAHLVPARRAINSQGARRGPVAEYIITNVGVLN
jgi:DNA adenine methylase